MSWNSLKPGELVIGDTDPTPMTPNAMSTGYEKRDYAAHPHGSLPYAKAFDMPLIPRSEWDDRIAEMEKTKSRLSDLVLAAGIPSKDQNGTNYCWFNGVITACETLRCVEGLPYVALSSASGAAPIKGFRNNGGWGGDALEWMTEHGACSEDLWPNAAINRKYFTEEAKTQALLYRVTESTDVEQNDFEALMTMLFNRIPCPLGLDWWGHLICAMDPVKTGTKQYGVRIRNSWSDDYGDKGFAVLTERKSIGDVVAPRQMRAAQ